MKILLTAEHIAAANLFVADKSDPREYLRGIHLSRYGRIEASNGAITVGIDCPPLLQLDESVIIKLEQGATLPRKATSAEVDLDKGIITIRRTGKFLKVLRFEKIDAKYPVIANIVRNWDLTNHESVGFTTSYLALLNKAGKALGMQDAPVRMDFGGKHSPVKVSFLDPMGEGVEILLMQCKL